MKRYVVLQIVIFLHRRVTAEVTQGQNQLKYQRYNEKKRCSVAKQATITSNDEMALTTAIFEYPRIELNSPAASPFMT